MWSTIPISGSPAPSTSASWSSTTARTTWSRRNPGDNLSAIARWASHVPGATHPTASHSERSRPTFSSPFALAKGSACAERNLSSLLLLRFSSFCFLVSTFCGLKAYNALRNALNPAYHEGGNGHGTLSVARCLGLRHGLHAAG